MSIDADSFKDALGNWLSGVTIVTSRIGVLQSGMTVSAFCSVSAQPPQVLFCANRQSTTGSVIRQAKSFSVSILAREQERLSELFADDGREDVRFDGLHCSLGLTGSPRIPGALAHLDCSVAQVLEAGTHVIYVGLVEAADIADINDHEPLLFHRRQYRHLG